MFDLFVFYNSDFLENKELVNLESTDQKQEILAPDDGE